MTIPIFVQAAAAGVRTAAEALDNGGSVNAVHQALDAFHDAVRLSGGDPPTWNAKREALSIYTDAICALLAKSDG